MLYESIYKMKSKSYSRFIEESRVLCKCGHSISFTTRTPYIHCNFCGNLVFRNKKCEFDYKVKRKVVR